MIKKGRHLIKSYMTLEYDFTGIRIQESALTPVDWKLSVDLVAIDKKNKSKEDLEISASITYQKVYFWLDTNLPNIVAANVGNENDLYISNLTTNIMMYCPGNPGDDMIIQLLHSKISALASPDLIVGEIRLKGSDTNLQYTFDCIGNEYNLPATAKEYFPEGELRDIDPWWKRDDGFCFELIKDTDAPDDEDSVDNVVDPMDEFRAMVAEMSETQIGLIREPAKIVQIEKWKPKKVE